MLQSNFDEKIAIQAAATFNSTQHSDDVSVKLYETLIPSLADVEWTETASLRHRGAFRSLRRKIAEASVAGGGELDKARSEFQDFEDETTAEIIDRFRPKMRKVMLESVLANVPGLHVNPFSLFFGARDTYRARADGREHGWFYLLRDIRAAAKANAE